MSQINIKKTNSPLTPSTDRVGIFVDTTGQPKIINHEGTETPLAGIADAPSDGNPYVRKNAAWEVNTSVYQPAVERASNTVLFDKDYIIGNAGARTGNILFDFTGAQLGATTRMLHSDASAFIFNTTATINTLFDSYNGAGNNAIFIQLVKLGATEADHVIDVTLTAIT